MNNIIENKIEEFDQKYISEFRWKKDAINNLSASDFLRQSLNQVKEDTIKECEESYTTKVALEANKDLIKKFNNLK